MVRTTRTRLAVLLVLVVIGAVAALGVASVAAQDDAEDGASGDLTVQNGSYFRVVHAVPDAPAVDVSLDDRTVLENVSFTNVSDYLAVPGGTYNLTVTAADDADAVVLEETITVEPREPTTVTVTATGNATASSDVETTSWQDNALRPGEDEAAISVAHLVPGAPAVDVIVNGTDTVLADNVSYQEATEYVSVPAGDHTADVRATSPTDDGQLLATVDVTVEGGNAYTAFALAPAAEPAADGAALQVVPARDATMTIHLPAEISAANVTEATATETATTTPAPGTVTPASPTTETVATPENETVVPENETDVPGTETVAPGNVTVTPAPDTETVTTTTVG